MKHKTILIGLIVIVVAVPLAAGPRSSAALLTDCIATGESQMDNGFSEPVSGHPVASALSEESVGDESQSAVKRDSSTANRRSISLQECKDMAAFGNITVRNSHLDVLAARMLKRETLSLYFPTVNASALGEALPQLGVGASYGYGHVIGDPQTNGFVYATVKIPITDWSKTSSKMHRIDYQQEKTLNEREHSIALLQMKVSRMWIEVESCWEELLLRRETVALMERELSYARADLAAGLATGSDVMSRQVSLTEARCAEVDARIAYRNALSSYLSFLPAE